MSHQVFIRHTYIYKCSDKKCSEEWKINEASELDRLRCPYCGKHDVAIRGHWFCKSWKRGDADDPKTKSLN